MSSYRPKNKEDDFSYDHYDEILTHLRSSHKPITFNEAFYLGDKILDIGSYVLLRHDVEESTYRALEIAELDHKNNFKSTFFLLLTGKYNCFSEKDSENIRKILGLNHEIALHYDVSKLNNSDSIDSQIKQQAKMLEVFFNVEIKSISPHMPMRNGGVLKVQGFLNAYDDLYFKKSLYISDSSQKWRKGAYENLMMHKGGIQLLLHDNTWSKDSLSIQAISLLENIERMQHDIENSKKYINQYRHGIALREIKD